MGSIRQCSKTSCRDAAVATLTYNYADSTVVLGPMSQRAEPHTYDLCTRHATAMTAPKGWDLLRIAPPEDAPAPAAEEPDDLLALAHAVNEPDPAPASAARPTVDRGVTSTDSGRRPDPSGSVTGEAPARPGDRPSLRLLRGTEPR